MRGSVSLAVSPEITLQLCLLYDKSAGIARQDIK
jgi:hypothetical protein